jgi:hypothetical protein
VSWDGTFSHGIAIAVDYAVEAAWFWRDQAKMTVSSRCHQALLAGERTTFLALLGRFLNWLKAGHTQEAVQTDLARAAATTAELSTCARPIPE